MREHAPRTRVCAVPARSHCADVNACVLFVVSAPFSRWTPRASAWRLDSWMSEQAQALRSWGHERWTAILERRKTTCRGDRTRAAPRLLLPEDLSRPSASVRMLRPQSVLPKLIRKSRQPLTNLHAPNRRSARLSMALRSSFWTLAGFASLPLMCSQLTPTCARRKSRRRSRRWGSGSNQSTELVSSEAHGVDPMAAALYDRFHVGVSAIQVLLAPAKAEWRLPKVQQRLQLVYQFGLDLSLYTCILPPGGHPFEQLVVTAALAEGAPSPSSLRLSSSQLRALRAIARAAGGGSGGGGSATPTITAAGSDSRKLAQEHAREAKDPAQEVKVQCSTSAAASSCST